VAEKSWPSKKDASFSARTPRNFLGHIFLFSIKCYIADGKKKTMRLDVGVFPLRTVYIVRGNYPSLTYFYRQKVKGL
jgi:hypothetical protein